MNYKITNLRWLIGLILVAFWGYGFSQNTTTPLNEDFEGDWPVGGVISGWTMQNLNTNSASEWKQSSFGGDHTSGTGKYAAYECYNYSNSNGNRTAALVSPIINVTANDHILSFWAKYIFADGDFGSDDELYVDVEYPTNTWTTLTANLVAGQTNTGWFQEFIDLNSYIGNDVTIRFRGISHYGSYNIGIDDVIFPYADATAPVAVTNIAPENGATGIDNGSSLTWEFGANTDEYQLMLGTMNPPTTVVVDFTSTLATSYTLDGLEYNTTYYWQVNAKNEEGTTLGEVWSFTTVAELSEPGAVTNIAPLNGSTGIDNGSLLSWQFGANTDEYQLMLGTMNPPITVAIDFTTALATSYTLEGLEDNTTYYWQVNARNEAGTTPGVVWSFTTAAALPAPDPVTYVSPLDGATNIKNGSMLSWIFGGNTDGYQVMLGTTNPPADTVMPFTTSLATSYILAGLAHNTTYYWQVNAANGSVTTAGDVWSFTTNTPSFYESFEGEAFPPEGWSMINDNNPTEFWERGVWADYALTGVGFARINHNDNQALDDWLITPKFAPEEGNSTLSFWARSLNADLEKFNVMLSTTGINKEDFTVTLASGVEPPTTYTYYSYDLSGYNGQTVYIAVQAVSSGWTWSLFLDDFEGPNVYSGTPAPVAVTNIAPVNGATGIEDGSLLTWEFGANTDEYQVMLGTNNPPTTVVVDYTSPLETSYTLTGLDPNTTYYWQVNAKNEGGTTAGPVWSFATVIDIGINNPEGAEAILVYAYGNVLYLETASAEVSLINVFDINGKLVMQGKTNGKSLSTLNISALNTGIYVVNLVLKNGVVSRKVYIQK